MFVHLHCHFTGSYSDSTLQFEPALHKAKNDRQPAIAMTEHGEMPFVFRFLDAARGAGVKPLFGAELYFVEDAPANIEKNIKERFHFVALAKSPEGLRNLYRLTSDAWTENSYKEQRGLVDWTLLEKYRPGLVLLTGCYFNIIGQTIARKSMEEGEQVLHRCLDLFGKDFYLELGRHGIEEEEKVNAGVLELAKKHGITPVVTNDVHYLDDGDWELHDIIIKTRYDLKKDFKANAFSYWLKTEREMRALGFPDEYCERSLEVTDTIESFDPGTLRCEGAAGPVADPEALIGKGEAAYLSRVVEIDYETALRHAADVLKKDDPRIPFFAEKLVGIPRRTEPDPGKIVCTPGRPLKDFVPLKRTLGKICTQWDEESCRRAGAQILPAFPSPMTEAFKNIRL